MEKNENQKIQMTQKQKTCIMPSTESLSIKFKQFVCTSFSSEKNMFYVNVILLFMCPVPWCWHQQVTCYVQDTWHVTRDTWHVVTWYLPWLDLTGLDRVAVAALRRSPVKQMLTAENGQITSNSNNLTYNNSSTKINREQSRNQYAK